MAEIFLRVAHMAGADVGWLIDDSTEQLLGFEVVGTPQRPLTVRARRNSGQQRTLAEEPDVRLSRRSLLAQQNQLRVVFENYVDADDGPGSRWVIPVSFQIREL